MRDARSLWPRTRTDEGWQTLDQSAVSRAPDAYGVVEIANGRKARILVVHGALREELERILEDPMAKEHDARFYRCHVTLTPDQAKRLQEDLLRGYEAVGLPRPFVGRFSERPQTETPRADSES